MLTKSTTTLKKQYLRVMLLTLLILVLLSGSIQIYLLSEQVQARVNGEAHLVAQNVQQGVEETDLAAQEIEHQLDLKLKILAERIGDALGQRSYETISNEELIALKDRLKLAGISLLAREGQDDVVIKRSTDQAELGFSFKSASGASYAIPTLFNLLDGKKPDSAMTSYADENSIILFTQQSGSHTDEPMFFKYGYYHGEGHDFIIAPYIEANEVYRFTKAVGPDQLIDKVVESNKYVEEIAVLDKRVYSDPSIAEQFFPPLTKVIHGQFEYQDEKDESTIRSLNDNNKVTSYVANAQSRKVYKMFIPYDDHRMIYVALDYSAMVAPVYRHSAALVVLGMLSLIALFLLTTRFFSAIYRNIQNIIKQTKSLEAGDFTAKSKVDGTGELADLSASANHMVDTLNAVLTETAKQAYHAQKLASALEAEANQSVDKMYQLSIETTFNARDADREVDGFFAGLESNISLIGVDHADILRNQIENIRHLITTRSETATDITISLSDLLKSLHEQSSDLSKISTTLLGQLDKFKL